MNEIWKDIIGYEGLYKISSEGEIKSLEKTWIAGTNSPRWKPETLLSICVSTEYHNVRLHKKGHKSKFFHIHRLLAQHFIPNPENKREVNHKNGNKHDNRIDNLEWVTSSENRRHAFDTGLKVSPKGSSHYSAIPIIYIEESTNRTVAFPCIMDAVRQTGFGESFIRHRLKGRVKNIRNKFIYL